MTLKNAIKNKQLAHAYLFCGPRGVGKTTCARIFAKTINCENISPENEACNECASCKSFNDNRSYNIHELDAASNNSVDDIRLLIDKVRVPPQMGNYSVYIIDEVHMLSSNAFNAFLKTLEEPPHHAIFILATTEKHKILPTILSRCQTFDFNRITVETASSYLKYVAEKESVAIEEEALNVIATKADGAMRDALSIFDQIVAFSGKNITYQQVISNLNVLDYDYYFKLLDAFLKEDVSSALIIFNEILKHGFDGSHFIGGLSSHLRDLMMCRDPQTVSLLEVGASIKQRYLEQAQLCDNDFLYEALRLTTNCELNYRIARNKRLHVEFTIISLSRIITEKKKAAELKRKQKEAIDNKSNNHNSQPTSSKEESSSTPPAKAGIASISLKNLMKGKPLAEKVDDEIVKKSDTDQQTTEQNEDVNPQELKKAWLEYAEQIKSENMRLFSILTAHQAELFNSTIIRIQLSGQIQMDELANAKAELMLFLKKRLKNSKLTLEISIRPEDLAVEKKAFTAAEKFEAMIQKNPALAVLKQKFNLDLE